MGSLLTILLMLCLVKSKSRMHKRVATVCQAQETDQSLLTSWEWELVPITSALTNISNLWLRHKWFKADKVRKIWKRGKWQNHLRTREDPVHPRNPWGHLAGHSLVNSITTWGIRKITHLLIKTTWLITLRISPPGLLLEVRLFQ